MSDNKAPSTEVAAAAAAAAAAKAKVRYITFGEAADRLGTRYQVIYNRYKTGTLAGAKQAKVGNDLIWVVPVETVERWIAQRALGRKGKKITGEFTLS